MRLESALAANLHWIRAVEQEKRHARPRQKTGVGDHGNKRYIDLIEVELNDDETPLASYRLAAVLVPLAPKAPDYRPLTERIDKLEKSVQAIPAPADFTPLVRRIDTLEQRLGKFPKPEKVDLQPIDGRLR